MSYPEMSRRNVTFRCSRRQRHKLPVSFRIVSKPIFGGLHHDYRLEKEAA